MSANPMPPTGDSAERTGRGWLRLHQALMPDYNRKAALYWWCVVLMGAGILAWAMRDLLALPVRDLMVVSAGVAMAMVTGLFPIRIPRWKTAFTAGEVFIFLLLLLHGPAAAVVAAACEALLGSWRTSKRWTSRLASPAIASIAMLGVGWALTAGLAAMNVRGLGDAGLMLAATMGGAVLYFLLNALLMTAVFHLKRNHWPSVEDLFGNFGWMAVTNAASASIACLLFLSTQQSGIGVLLAASPILVLLLVTLNVYFRQRETDDEARVARLEAAEREARLAASHVIELRASEQRFHSAFSHASIGMALVGFDARILQANTALRALLGFEDEGGLETRALIDFVEPGDRAVLLAHIQRLQRSDVSSFAAELSLRPRDERASRLWATVHGSLFTEVGSEAPCLILQVQDVTARRTAEANLQHIAFHDSLTGLPNRHRFQQLLTAALEQARAHQGKPFGLMFLDFDRFKLINDSLGHAVGDKFLVAVAQRIKHQLRPGDVVARLGGDEFAILASDLDSERYAVGLANRLLHALRDPFQIAGTEITSSVSIGITFSAAGYNSTSDMLRDADTAMYKAKSSGKARFALFDHALHVEVAHRMRLETDLRRALADGAFSICYQPLFDLATGRVVGLEALSRWHHAELGDIEPSVFIPVAEEAGLMPALTDKVLDAACRQLRAWQGRAEGLADLRLHVNLSDVDVAHPNLVSRIGRAIAEAGIRPQQLTLELTENTLMQRLEGALPALTALRHSGVGLSIDDFGTGYSSLRHLSSLPVDGLKLAPGFVADLGGDADAQVIVNAIVMMGGSLAKSITAEGIETADQLDRLRRAGCQWGQGYYLAPPMSVGEVDALLDAGASWPAPAPKGGADFSASLLH